MSTLEELENAPQDDLIDQEIFESSTADILNRTKLLDNDIKVMRSESQRLTHEKTVMLERIKDNQEKINNNKQLPYLVGNVVELLDLDAEKEASEQGANVDLAIKAVKPGLVFRDLGNIIEEFASKNSCSVVRTYCGHGIGELFHCQPNIPHYAKNKAIGIAKPGMVFTIEPMLCLGTYKDVTWPDNWTAVTQDGKYSAQFEQMLLVTEDGCEVLTARNENSPGGPVPRI